VFYCCLDIYIYIYIYINKNSGYKKWNIFHWYFTPKWIFHVYLFIFFQLNIFMFLPFLLLLFRNSNKIFSLLDELGTNDDINLTVKWSLHFIHHLHLAALSMTTKISLLFSLKALPWRCRFWICCSIFLDELTSTYFIALSRVLWKGVVVHWLLLLHYIIS